MLVSVTSIVSIRPFGSIFGAKIEDQSHPSVGTMIRVKASAKGMLGQPVVGDVWDVQGSLIDTPGDSYDRYAAWIQPVDATH